MANHADIENISALSYEKEVLFFPFAPFEVKAIRKKIYGNKILYNIYLYHLGPKYVTLLEILYKQIGQEIEEENIKIKKLEKEIEKQKNYFLKEENKEEEKKEEEKIEEKENLIIEHKKKINDNNLKMQNVSTLEFKKQIVESGLISEIDKIDLLYLLKMYKKYKKTLQNPKKGTRNMIIGKIKIYDFFVNKKVRILNSFGKNRPNHYNIQTTELYKYENEKEIKKNTIIRINGKQIKFSYYHIFRKKGEYTIEYIFKNSLEKVDYMFSDCNLITYLDLSYFDSDNVINMSGMFNCCKSLKQINLTNINTEEVFNMRRMFMGCKSLLSLDLSYFDTRNVVDMRDMFNNCSSLTTLNLSNFITKKVTNMSNMFNSCSSLANLNLSNFDVKNVNVMWNMFHGCVSLKPKSIINKNLKLIEEAKNIKFI